MTTLSRPKPNGHPAPPIVQATPEVERPFPFNQGIDRDATIRLMNGTHTRADRAMYYFCPWWQSKKGEALEHYGRSCCLCGSELNLQVHHRGSRAYKRLFTENIKTDLSVLCDRDHKRYHRS